MRRSRSRAYRGRRAHAEVTARAAEAGAAEDRLRAVLDALLDRVALLLGELARGHLRVDLVLERLLERVAQLAGSTPSVPAASLTIAWLRAWGESSCDAAYAAPPLTTATTASADP